MTDESCPFCGDSATSRAIDALRTVFAVRDLYPVTEGHMLIIPLRHTPDFFTMTWVERKDAFELADRLRRGIVEDDPRVAGFNLGVNCGGAAGQTVAHAHIHLIPRRAGDAADPKGGVRGVIPERMKY